MKSILAFFHSLHVYHEGYSAFWGKQECPYLRGTKDYEMWCRGFNASLEANSPVMSVE